MARALIVFGLLAALVSGCTKPEAAFAGKWQLDPKSVKSSDPKADPNIGMGLGLMVLDFKIDKSYVLSSRDGDQTGTFTVEDGTVTMTTETPAADGVRRPFKGKLTADAKSMTVTGGNLALTMKFNKL